MTGRDGDAMGRDGDVTRGVMVGATREAADPRPIQAERDATRSARLGVSSPWRS